MFKLIIVFLCLIGLSPRHDVLAGERADSFRIAVAIYSTSPKYMQSWLDSLNEHPAVKDGRAQITVYDGGGSHISQYDQVTTIVTKRYDAMILIPSDYVSGTILVHMATQGGVPVIGSCGPVESTELVSYIGSDEEEAGYVIAKSVIEKAGGKGNFVVLKGPAEMGATIGRDRGVAVALSEYPEARILDGKHANWLRHEAETIMTQWLVNYEGRIDGVICQNDEMALGAVDALKKAEVPIPPISGVDGIPEALAALERGELYLTLSQDAKTEAQGALDLVFRLLVGAEYRPESPSWNLYPEMKWNGGVETRYNVPWRTLGEK